MAETQLNILRSILRSDDDLQIQPSGDYEQVRIKLDHDIQISFFFDSLQLLNQLLTINNVHDLRIQKSSNKCPLNKDQWNKIRKYFDELLQDKSSSIQSIIQLIQDDLLQMGIINNTSKRNDKKSSASGSTEDASSTTSKFRGADLIFSRILHDKNIDRSEVVIGYEDRFTGIHEIAFNEFKKTQNVEHGIPMHRVRYFKINGRMVWDRTNKIDILTGSEEQNEILNDNGQSSRFVQGLYHFDQSLHQWIQDPHTLLQDDDSTIPSTNDTCLPQQCHFVTWNILFDYYHSEFIHTTLRYHAIFHTLRSTLPDLICLQEVTSKFLNLLLGETWLYENNYYLIIMQSTISSEKNKSYGQLMLMKNFRPRSFSICPLDVSDETAATKEIIVARFDLNSQITIDLVNLHLHNDISDDPEEKNCQALEDLLKRMNTNNYMLIGDFNFGDYDTKEQEMLRKHENEVHDLWKDIYDLEENPGFTYDPSHNVCANVTSLSQIKRRVDRYFIHTLQNLHYSIEHLNMIGINTIPIDRLNNDDDKRINLSDHYALQLILHFQIRSVSHRSALVILPTTNHSSFIDSSFNLWPPHINLLWPFFDLTNCQDDEENILLPLRLLLCQYQSSNLNINEIDTFIENNICFMKLNKQSSEYVKQLYEQLKQLFPQCCINSYNPRITIAQFDSEEKRNQAKSSLTLTKPFEFPLEYVYILQRPDDVDTTPFQITYQLPLGPVLQSLHSKRLNCIDSKLQEWFEKTNLYESEQSYQRKQDKFEKLSSCFDQKLNENTLHCFTHAFLPYGSFRIGINGADVDTVFVLSEVKSKDAQATAFDETFRQLKDDSNALNNHIIDLLVTQIEENLKDEIVYHRKIQESAPIIYIVFNDQTKVKIFVQVTTTQTQSLESTNGVHEMELLLIHSRSPPIFQHLLTFIRSWAQHVGIYGQVYGYLSGYSWAILCAHICHSFLSSIKSLSSIENFSIDDFFALVQKFFSTYASFPWSSQSLHLHSKPPKQVIQSQKSSVLNCGAMRIISPSAPYSNTGRPTFNSTRDLIVQSFEHVVELLDGINTINCEDKYNALKKILELNNDFPNGKIKSLLQLTLEGGNSNELDEWIGWMKSHLAHFINNCEEDCHLTTQPQNPIEYRASKTTEALYSIGFQLDEHALIQHRNFNYWLNQFLDQFNLYSNRKETMKISQRIVSIHDWKLERMQPKPQRIRK